MMLCPKCKGKTKVFDSRRFGEYSGRPLGYIWRRRECKVCGYRITTKELIIKKEEDQDDY